jgi:predicted metal-dependent hydrolase
MVHPDKTVEILAPVSLKDAEIDAVVARKRHWIAARLKEMDSCDFQTPQHRYEEGELFLFRGKHLLLTLVDGRDEVCFDNDKLLVAVPHVLTQEERSNYIQERLRRWFFLKAQEILRKKTFEYALLCGCTPVFVSVKEYRSRWGCCFSDGRIYYNWKIIMAPEEIINYVIIHELCHLLEANHSGRYWALVEKRVPDWQEKRNWLRRNGHRLNL